MQIVLIKTNKLFKYSFPNENISTYWIKDFDENNNERDLISLEKKDNDWFLIANETCSVEERGRSIKQLRIEEDIFYSLKISEINSKISAAYLYVHPENDTSYTSYMVTEQGEYKIGSSSSNDIVLRSDFISPNHATLVKDEKGFTINNNDSKYGVYVNNNKIISKKLESGDVMFFYGYNIIVLGDYLIINGKIKINSEKIIEKSLPEFDGELLETEEDDNASVYNENDYYSRQPRFTTSVVVEQLKIDSPPGKVQEDDTPLLYTIGPMITMTMTSALSVITSVMSLMNGNSSTASALPAIIISVAMIASTILWPSLMRRFQKKKQKHLLQQLQAVRITM